jgi:predicted DNA-binding protein with PD1-like motif
MSESYISRSGGVGRIVVARLKHGCDLMQSLQQIVEEKGLEAAVIISGVGLLSNVKLRNCKTLPEKFPITDKNRSFLSFEKPLEILGISGNVSIAERKPLVHAHLTLSYTEKEKIRVIGGHLIEGCKVFGFAEVFIMELTKIEMVKKN